MARFAVLPGPTFDMDADGLNPDNRKSVTCVKGQFPGAGYFLVFFLRESYGCSDARTEPVSVASFR
jgi:hypothetical protein